MFRSFEEIPFKRCRVAEADVGVIFHEFTAKLARLCPERGGECHARVARHVVAVLQIVYDEDVGKLERIFFRDLVNAEGTRLALVGAGIPAVNLIGSRIEDRLPVAEDVFGLRVRGNTDDSSRRALSLDYPSHSGAGVRRYLADEFFPVVIFKIHFLRVEREDSGTVFVKAGLEAVVHEFFVFGTDIRAQL